MPASAIRAPLARFRPGGLDDVRLAELAGQGDERAFEVLYDRHHRALLGFCRHMLGSHEEGEDALQQTFLRAHRALLSRGAPDEVRPWLFAIARNRCLTMLAARKAAAAVPGDGVEPATEGLGSAVERRADLRALLADVERLPVDQRSALVLAEVGDLPHAEIAAVIGVPATKVKALVHQARSRLIAEREARETPCALVREQLSTARGGELRRGPLRRHLRLCEPCREYRSAVAEQRAALGLVLPVLPSAGLKDAILGAISGGGGGGAAAGAALSGGSVGLAAKGLGAKLAVGAALAGGAGGGAVAVKDMAAAPDVPGSPAAAVQPPATPPAAAVQPPATAPAGGGGAPVAERRTEVGIRERPAPGRRGAGQRGRRVAHGKAKPKRERQARARARSERAEERAVAKEQRRQDRVVAKDQRRESRTTPLPPVKTGRERAAVPRPEPAKAPKDEVSATVPDMPVAPKRQDLNRQHLEEPLP